MILANPMTPMGDSLGTFPATIALAKKCQERGEELTMWVQPYPYYHLLPKKYGVRLHVADEWNWPKDVTPDFRFDLHHCAWWCNSYDKYMTQGFFRDVGMEVPKVAPPAELELRESENVKVGGDVGLAPFSRCLPEWEKWPRKQWQRLVEAHPAVHFVLYGDVRYDDPAFVTGQNVTPYFGHTVEQAAMSIRDLTRGIISVSTGLSHLAFAVGTPNLLLINQGSFAKNPVALKIEQHVESIPFEKVCERLGELWRP